MERIHTVLDRQPANARAVLPAALSDLYHGDLQFSTTSSRPYVIGNFVETLDGVVSYSIPRKSGGQQISGSNEGDRFTMGLLRASADAVIVGSGTVHAVSPRHEWTAEYVYPAAKDVFIEYRERLGKPRHPLTVIVSGSGRLELERAVFHASELHVLIITTAKGKQQLDHVHISDLASVQVRAIGEHGSIPASAILQLLWSEFQVRLLLHEGGPTLFGRFVAEGNVDELFLTVAPQIAGRSATVTRPGFVERVAFPPETAPWLRLVTVKQSGDHLYLRYRLGSEG